MRRKPGHDSRGLLSVGGGISFDVALGKGGISAFKREGDGATPRTKMAVLHGYWRADKGPRPETALPMRPIRHDAGWCDAPWHAAYNRPVRLPFPQSAETMWRTDDLYDIVLVLDWNIGRRQAGRGSAIFMHLARPGYLPTEGCIALKRRDMLRLIQFVSSFTRVAVIG